MKIHQGHKYSYWGREVLALESGDGSLRIATIDHSQPYPLGAATMVYAADLIPLPMVYYANQVPG